MSLHISVTGYDEAVKRIDGIPERVRRAMVDQIQSREVRPAYQLMRSKARGPHARVAAGTLRVTNSGDGATISGGGAGGLGATVFAGAEFGGRKRRRTYAMRRKGTAFVVHKRRTTMQFLPNVGKRGYFFWPSVREKFRGIGKRMSLRLEDEVGRG